MWVIVIGRVCDRYRGVLDNDPGRAEGLRLHEGDEITFGPEHIADMATLHVHTWSRSTAQRCLRMMAQAQDGDESDKRSALAQQTVGPLSMVD